MHTDSLQTAIFTKVLQTVTQSANNKINRQNKVTEKTIESTEKHMDSMESNFYLLFYCFDKLIIIDIRVD